MGLESISYEVFENVSKVEVCAIVREALVSSNNTDIPCPVNFSFNVSLSASDLTSAGNEYHTAFYPLDIDGLYIHL